jgi:2-polyprenyl-3-methyl-5-hydroxy-6-metoxy-1,4-benzoquinol methylase
MHPVVILAGYIVFGRAYQAVEKDNAFNNAVSAARSSGKPLLNAGCGGDWHHWMAKDISSISDVNVDIVERDVPNFVLTSIEDMPMFEDKQFGAAFCSHVIEHVDDPDKAMAELNRVADEVFVITPEWWDILTYVNPNHKHLRTPAGNFVEIRG